MERLKKRRPRKRKQAMIIDFSMFHIADKGSESWRIPAWNLMFSLFLPPKIASVVQLYADVAIFAASASFLSLSYSGEAKKAQTEKADKSMIWTFIRHKYRKSWWNPIGFLRRNNYPPFLPPKPVSAVRQYGDESCFDASASFLSLSGIGEAKMQKPPCVTDFQDNQPWK